MELRRLIIEWDSLTAVLPAEVLSAAVKNYSDKVLERVLKTSAIDAPRVRKAREDRNYRFKVKLTPAEMLERRLAGETLEQIGQAAGVTRERARQLIKRAEPNINARLSELKAKKAPPPRIKNFKQVIYRWLLWAGYARCQQCQTVKALSEFNPAVAKGNPHRFCRPCNASRASEQWHKSERIRATQAKWQRENKDKVREYVRRYQQSEKYRSRMRQYNRRQYLTIRNDPAKWEAYKAAKREYDRKRWDDPVIAERLREQARQKYARRKQKKAERANG